MLAPVAAAGGVAALALLYPTRTASLAPQPAPVRSWDAALARLDALHQGDGPHVNPLCRTIALAHGRVVERAVVLFHGFTNCPQQFRLLGEQLHARGFNVLIPRMPHHGLSDRLTEDLSGLRAEDLARHVDTSVDIARGMGAHVTVTGLSAGGILTAWAAQTRSDVDRAVLLSPAFAPGTQLLPRVLSGASVDVLTNVLLRLPNQFRWWDNASEDGDDGSPMRAYAYPRYATRAFGEVMRLGLAVQRRAATEAPAAGAILVVFNPSDRDVDNDLTAALVERWRGRGTSRVDTWAFDADLALIHDFIDPNQRQQQVETVYPLLLDLLNAR
jgi:carboxylesterase